MQSQGYKEAGNQHFKSGNFEAAADAYSEAINLDPDNAVLYSNRSAAFLKLLKPEKALEDAERCIQLNPTWEKGHFRKAAVFEHQGDLSKSVECLLEVLKIQPKNDAIEDKIDKLQRACEKQKRRKEAQQHSAFNAQNAMNFNRQVPVGQPANCAWAVGMSEAEQHEWLVNCYQMRCDDDYAWGGGFLHGVYDVGADKTDIVEDFLIFCQLAVKHSVIPPGWNWAPFVTVAGQDIVYAFEKSDAQEKYGSENIFNAMMGGRSLRYTAEMVYRCSCQAGENLSPEYEKMRETIQGQWRNLLCDPAFFHDVGGIGPWKQLQRTLVVRRM